MSHDRAARQRRRGFAAPGGLRLLAPLAERPWLATAAAFLIAVTCLVIAQFADLSQVRAGAPQYAPVEEVAAAPLVESRRLGSAHGWVVVPIAFLALASIALAIGLGRARLARLTAPLGGAVVAITLIHDLPRGTDVGEAGVAYAGASASLGAGWWTQLAAGIALLVLGPLLAAQLPARAEPKPRRRRARPASTPSEGDA